jgi:putative endonuclease
VLFTGGVLKKRPMNLSNYSKIIGDIGEDLVAKHIQGLGWKLLGKNIYNRFGEIDLIAQDGPEIVFIEVKSRTKETYGSALEAITRQKFQKILAAGQTYLLEKGWERMPYRVDAFTVTGERPLSEKSIEHFPNIAIA